MTLFTGHTGAVPGIDRVDRVIAIVLVALLAALAGLGLSENSGGPTPSASGSISATTSAPTTTPGLSGPKPATVPSSLTTGSSIGATAPSSTPASGTAPTTATTVARVPGPVTAVGDSIMLDIQPELTADIPGVTVDGLVSRQFQAGIGVVQADRAAGTMGRVLVVELGTNGPITPSDVDAMMQAAGGVTRVVFVNVNVPRQWAADDNAVLAAGVARYPGTAVLADWYALSTPHPEWFTADGVHLNPAGAAALAGLIASDA